MKKSATEFKFNNFKEMVDFLVNNHNGNRYIKYKEDGQLLYLEGDEEFLLDEYEGNENIGCTPLTDYYDAETGEVDNEGFAQEYNIDDFRGYEPVNE